MGTDMLRLTEPPLCIPGLAPPNFVGRAAEQSELAGSGGKVFRTQG
jgi:hypothetical protein